VRGVEEFLGNLRSGMSINTHRRAFRRALPAALITLSLCCPSGTALAGEPNGRGDSVVLGSVRLSLGMSEGDVIKQLSAQFELKEHSQAGPSSVWEVCEKASAERPCLGSVGFEKGKLFEAARRWRQDGTPADLSRFLQAIVARFVAEGTTSCRLDAIKLHDQFSTDESSLVICGHKQIRIGFITTSPDSKPYVIEVLSNGNSD